MPFEITMPQLGLTMEVGTVTEWLVKAGDPIKHGQEIFNVETDKAVVAVESREIGTIARVLIPAGQQVPVGTVLAVGLKEGETMPADWQASRPDVAPDVAPEPEREVAPAPAPAPATAITAKTGPLEATWKARAMAREAGLDLGAVAGSGPAGRIAAADVSAALAAQTPASSFEEIKATPVAINLAAALGLDLSQVTGTGSQGRISQSDVLEAAAALIRQKAAAPAARARGLPQVASTTPLTSVRKIVSEGMARSVHTSARVTLFREIDATELLQLRGRFKAQGTNVSYNDILVLICAQALGEHPEANARLGNGQIEHLDRVNIGLAVDTDRGLLVPVVHNAHLLTIPQIAAESARLIEGARTGRISPDDLTAGTFTITNLGMLGVEGFTPVINLPEACILGVGRIVRKPVVIDDQDTVAVRPTMILSLVFDHRVIDGAPAARFLDRIAQLVQDPMLLLTA